MNSYYGSSFRTERDALVAALRRARSFSINNICLGNCDGGKPHGVHITSTSYTIFQGSTYDTRDSGTDEIINIGPNLKITPGGFTEVVFSNLSGDATTLPSDTHELTLIDMTTGKNSIITINNFGQISWTN